MASETHRRPFTQVLKELAESSTVHGIPKIASSRQVAVKVLWCILMIAGFCILTVQLVALFRTFKSHPVQTTVSLDFSSLRFPAISFCNMNPVRKSKIGMSTQLRDTFYPQKKNNTPTIMDGIPEPLPEKAIRGVRKENDTLAMGALPEADDSVLSSYLDDNQTTSDTTETFSENTTAYDTMETYSENTTAYDTLNESVTENPNESSSYAYFTYDNYDHYGWDIFDSHNNENYFNLSFGNLSFVHHHEATENLNEHYQDPQDKWDKLITNFKTVFRNVPVRKRDRMGHQMSDFIQYVSFARREQQLSKYVKKFTTSDYGNCFTMDHPKYKAWGSGLDSGIKLTLNLEIDEYIENFSSGYGVRIVFHEPGTFPMPAEEGLTLSPGYETNIGLRAINVTRLGEPYGNCTQDGNKEFLRKYNMTYSKTACLAFCRVESVIDTCGCLPFDAPDINFKIKQPICGMDMWDEYCVFMVLDKFELGVLGCDCISPCSEFVYSKTTSGRVWPHKDYLEKVLMKDICVKNLTSLKDACHQIENDTRDFNYERYKNNFVRVLIYFEDLNYEKITEEPFYTPVRFVSDIGGAVGLFMGVSLLSLFEVFQLILEIVLHLFHRKRNNSMTKDNKALEQNNV